MNLREAFGSELRVEARSTRRMLERVPGESFDWKPHERSMPLGMIAAHIANIPGLFLAPLLQDEFDYNDYQGLTETLPDLLSTFDRNIAAGMEAIGRLSEEQWSAPWRFRYGGRVIFDHPRLVVVRSTALNHLIHHRGQLSVYLRLLDVPLPSVYGPTADA